MKAIIQQGLQYLYVSLINPGGINFRLSRYAGNLATTTPELEPYLAICHSVIFKNGVRKTTNTHRNVSAIHQFLARFKPENPNPALQILDIGSSIGVDAYSNYEAIAEKHPIQRYCLGDLYTSIYVDEQNGVVFDPDREVLQIRTKLFFYNVNFEYSTRLQKIINFPNHLLKSILMKNLTFNASQVKEVALISPKLVYENSPFVLKRMDVFKKMDESFDLIICFHLLVDRYFSKEQIAFATQNLIQALNPGGILLVGAIEDYKIVRKDANHQVTEERIVA